MEGSYVLERMSIASVPFRSFWKQLLTCAIFSCSASFCWSISEGGDWCCCVPGVIRFNWVFFVGWVRCISGDVGLQCFRFLGDESVSQTNCTCLRWDHTTIQQHEQYKSIEPTKIVARKVLSTAGNRFNSKRQAKLPHKLCRLFVWLSHTKLDNISIFQCNLFQSCDPFVIDKNTIETLKGEWKVINNSQRVPICVAAFRA